MRCVHLVSSSWLEESAALHKLARAAITGKFFVFVVNAEGCVWRADQSESDIKLTWLSKFFKKARYKGLYNLKKRKIDEAKHN